MNRLIRAVIDTDALRANLSRIRAVAPDSQVLAVVKANAYGHGLVPVAKALRAADAFGVARLEEGVVLRDAAIVQPIVLLEGVFSPGQLTEAAERRLEIVVHETEQIQLLEAYRGSHRFRVWLKIDTGMNRLGFRTERAAAALDRLRALTHAVEEIRLMTHLARADERASDETAHQVRRFEAIAVGQSLVTSIGNSAGIFAWPHARGQWVRPGLALYGVSPFEGETGASLGLRPAMTLATTVIALRNVPKGEAVGYGGGWRAPRDSVIAVVAAGYGDGLPRAMASGTPVLIQGRRVPLVARVSMDMITVDVTDLPGVQVGSPAILWGNGLPAEDVAPGAGTIAYELLCGVSQRVPLEFPTRE